MSKHGKQVITLLAIAIYAAGGCGSSHDEWIEMDEGSIDAESSPGSMPQRVGGSMTPLWEEKKLVASDGAQNNWLGTATALDGDTAIVGAPIALVADVADQGAVYVFTRNGNEWTETQKLVPESSPAHRMFGDSVAISDDTLIVGAPADGSLGLEAMFGSAHVFVRKNGQWTFQQKLVLNDAASGDEFGRAVAIDGDTAIVTATRRDVGANVDQGSAYVFTRSGETWTTAQTLTASDGAASAEFGNSVAISGDTAFVGAGPGGGAVYVFTKSAGTWTETQKIANSNGATTYSRTLRECGPDRGSAGRHARTNQSRIGIRIHALGWRMERAAMAHGERRG